MQDGTHGTLFELTSISAESTRVGFSISPETCGNAPSSFYAPSSRRPWPNMLYGSEPWSCSSIPLSIFTNGGYMPAAGTQLGHGRNSSPTHPDNATERGPKIPSSNGSSSSGLKERDYIGLADSSSTGMQRANFAVTSPVEKFCSEVNFNLDCKDTELRLGLGLSFVHQGDASQVDAVKVETRLDCNVVETETSKSCNSEQSPRVEQQQVPESLTYTGKVYSEQCIADKLGNGCSTSENVFGSHALGAIGSHATRDSFKVQRNDEQYFLSQRASALLPSGADTQKLSAQEGLGNDQHRSSKENSVGLPAQRVLPAESRFSRDGISLPHSDIARLEVPYGHGHAPLLRCNYEPRFAQHDSLASTEKSSSNTQGAQKPWQKSLPNDSLRSSTLQSGNISEFDSGSMASELLPRGMFMIPVPNGLTIPAKRPFCEAIGDSKIIHSSEIRAEGRANMSVAGGTAHTGINLSTFGTSTVDGEMKPGPSQVAKVHPASRLFSWNNVIPQPAGWQTGLEQSKGLFSTIVPASASLSSRVQAPPQSKTACASGHDSAKEAPVKALAFPGQQASNHGHSGDGGSRAPAVVGWPPIRSFRKNTLASQKLHADQDQDPPASPTDATDQAKQPSSPTLFVKANMDGVPIGRKVDLKSYDSYESLKSALQDMFQRFTNGPNTPGMECASKIEHKQENLLDGADYVLTHEDKDGDWMLVGDVPWNMFVTTVKRLRIMKVSEAIGLGPKLKIQSNNHLVEGARGK